MIDVFNIRCLHEGCTKQPRFNIEGKKPLYCAKHKAGDMINLFSKKCSHVGCSKQPNYNLEGEKPLYCAKHKAGGMIHVYKNKKRNLSESTNTRDNELLEKRVFKRCNF